MDSLPLSHLESSCRNSGNYINTFLLNFSFYSMNIFLPIHLKKLFQELAKNFKGLKFSPKIKTSHSISTYFVASSHNPIYFPCHKIKTSITAIQWPGSTTLNHRAVLTAVTSTFHTAGHSPNTFLMKTGNQHLITRYNISQTILNFHHQHLLSIHQIAGSTNMQGHRCPHLPATGPIF